MARSGVWTPPLSTQPNGNVFPISRVKVVQVYSFGCEKRFAVSKRQLWADHESLSVSKCRGLLHGFYRFIQISL
jgi:hypothetical protein